MASHTDCDFSIYRPDPDHDSKEQRRRREERDFDHDDLQCSSYKGKLSQ